MAKLPSGENITKRALISDVAKTYDVLGWFSPTTIKVKILFQRLWELNVGWEDPVPTDICEEWLKWRTELKLLSDKLISRYYFPKDTSLGTLQFHGFSVASESAYSGVIYLRMVDSNGRLHVPLVTSKTKVAPIKRLTIPRLELCGARLLADLLSHVKKKTFRIPLVDVYVWTDSTIVFG